MLKKREFDQGFTLIEVVMSLVVIAIIGVVAGRGFLEIIAGYKMSKETALVTQQAQITMARIKKELASLTSISCGSDKMITYKITRSATESEDTATIYQTVDNKIQLKTGSTCTACSTCADGDTLVESVSEFSLSYCKDSATTCSTSFPVSDFTAATVVSVKVVLKLKGYEDTPIVVADPDIVILGLASGG